MKRVIQRVLLTLFILLSCLGVSWGQGSITWLAPVGFVTWQTNSTTYSPFFGGGTAGGGAVGAAGGSANPGPNFRYQLLYGAQYNGSTIAAPATLAALNTWSDSGLSATNSITVPGRQTPIAVSTHATTPAGFDGGKTNYVILVGWSANLGSTWAAAKANLNSLSSLGSISGQMFFGVSSVGYICPSSAGVDPGPSFFGNYPGGLFSTNTQLYLIGGLIFDNGGHPIITQYPQSQTANVGSSVSFTVQATNNPPFIYHWSKNSSPLPNGTNATLTINPVTTNDAGNYTVLVENIYGGVGVSATLTVYQPIPVITLQPQSQTVPAGSPVSLSVQATNSPPFTYQWYFNNSPLPGENNATLSYNPSYTNDTGSYYVTVSNTNGSVNSSAASLFVYQTAFIVTPPASHLVSYGDTTSFSVLADGFPTPTNFQWSFNGSPLSGSNSSSLLIAGVTTNKLGTYSVVVSNAYGSAQSSAALTMRPSLVIPFAGISGLWGQPGTLSVVAAGSGTLAYQWYKDGVAIAGANGANYSISSLQFTNGGAYSVVVSSAYGSVTNVAAVLEVRPSDTLFGVYAGITVQGTVGNSYLIQYSTDLANWITATNVTLDQPSLNWSDYSADFRFNPGRYYRVIPAP
jgi:hypothetical protein